MYNYTEVKAFRNEAYDILQDIVASGSHNSYASLTARNVMNHWQDAWDLYSALQKMADRFGRIIDIETREQPALETIATWFLRLTDVLDRYPDLEKLYERKQYSHT